MWLYALKVNYCMKRVAGKEHAHGIRMLQSLLLLWPQASVNPRYATIKCIIPLSAFRVQSAMSERSLVTHGQKNGEHPRANWYNFKNARTEW